MKIQWNSVNASNGKATITWPCGAFNARESYTVIASEGISSCETRTTQEDTGGYAEGIGIDQKYTDKVIFTVHSWAKVFALGIGY